VVPEYPHRASLKNMPDPPWSGISFRLARCGYSLRVTSQASYSPEYIAPTQKKNHAFFILEKGAKRVLKVRVIP
jgi:hypothetical protein